MVESALGMEAFSRVRSFHEVGHGMSVRKGASATVTSLSAIRVLALLTDPGPSADLLPFDLLSCSGISEFDLNLANGAFDCVVFDAALAGGWPADAAITLATRVGRNFPLIILLEQASDLMVVNNRSNARDVWCLIKSALQPGDLTAMLAGLATLKNVQARHGLRN